MKTKTKRGFTIIELIIVVAIIGLLSSVVMMFLGDAREKSRDNRRISDIKQIQTALELYHSDNDVYPDPASGCTGTGGFEATICNSGNFISSLQDGKYISKVPLDPKNDSAYYYAYYRYPPGSGGCQFPFAILGIKKFELNNQKVEVNAKCPNFDWKDTFEYSILLPE